jgi:hypothetical protein
VNFRRFRAVELPSISTHLDHGKYDFSDSISRSLSKIHFDQSVSREKKIESVSIVVFSKKKKKNLFGGFSWRKLFEIWSPK